jgi:PDDEXK-like family of unknown function
MAKPTTRYASVMDALPRAFVGPTSQLQQLVQLICVEMHRAFTTQGASIPPWRSRDSFLSKWTIPVSMRSAEARSTAFPQRHRAGICKALPKAKPAPVHGCHSAVLKRVGSMSRVSSFGALSDTGSDKIVAPL